MAARNETGLSPEAASIIHQDFDPHTTRRIMESGIIEQAVFGDLMGPVSTDDGHQYSRPLHLMDSRNLRLLHGNIVWFSEEGDTHERRKPYASPEDYIEIRDDYEKVKGFVAKSLDTGKIDTSFGGMGGEDLETNPALYLNFLYTASSHEPFRQNMEQAVSELLSEELDRDLTQLTFEEARERVAGSYEVLYGNKPDNYFNYSWTNRMAVERGADVLAYLDFDGARERGEAITNGESPVVEDYSFLSRLGNDQKGQTLKAEIEKILEKDRVYGFLDYLRIPKDERGLELRKKVATELLTTYRVPTIEEYRLKNRWTIPDEKIDETYEQGVENGSIMFIPHFEELPLETKQAIIDTQLDQDAESLLSRQHGYGHTNRYNRLSGLLEVVAAIGRRDNKLSELYPIIKGAIDSGKYSNLPDIKPAAFSVNIENQLLQALSAVQPGNELRDFWLERLADDKNKDRAISALRGFFSMDFSQVGLKSEIPNVLASIIKRGGDLNEKRFYGSSIGYEEKLIDTAIEFIAARAYEKRMFHYFDQSSGTLDFLVKYRTERGRYAYTFDRYTTDGQTTESVTYDASTDSIEGSEKFNDSVRAHIDSEGLRLARNLSLDTLLGRKIGNPAKAKLIEGLGKDAKGKYEGVISLNGHEYIFLFDPTANRLLVSKKLADLKNRFGKDTWDGKKPITKDAKKISWDDLVDLDTLGKEIDERVKREKAKRTIYAPEFSLEGRVSSQIEDSLLIIIKGRLINSGRDLIQ